MKILHTADIHLREYDDERWEALGNLIELGKQNKIDIFAICGDLFDKDIDAENLRPRIRQLFTNTGFKILIIPGNHDKDSYTSGKYFGADAVVLGGLPFEEYGGVRVVGMPFEPVGGEELLGRIRALSTFLTDDKRNVLLYHGELLDAFFSGMSRMDYGDEGEGRYMPVKLSYFEGLNIDYVLGGHFHSNFDVRHLPNGGYFVYPGSPISITRREVGQRRVNLFEIGAPPGEYVLDTPHFEEVTVQLDPLTDEHPLEMIRGHLRKVHPEARVILTVAGYINSEKTNMAETDLDSQIREMAVEKCVEYKSEFRDIHRILEDDLFKGFMHKLEQDNYPEGKAKQLRDIAMKAMMEAGL